ncbi:hypothetical protein WA556_002758, partial [Blastocystis sp. ATCC 50177/Nand II]
KLDHPRSESATRSTHVCTLAAPSSLSLEEVKTISATVERSKKRISRSVEKLAKYKQFIEQCCLSSLIKNYYTQYINEKRTVKSVALLETSQPDNRVVTEQADVAPKCTFAVIQDQGFMDFLVKNSKRSKQSAEVATFLSTVHLYRSELTVIHREYPKLIAAFRPLTAVL